jgi:phage FluMu protein Com
MSTFTTELTKDSAMPFDLFMNDTCPRCRKPIRLTIIEQHPTRADLSVHKFECADCGGVTTKTLFRKQVIAA